MLPSDAVGSGLAPAGLMTPILRFRPKALGRTKTVAMHLKRYVAQPGAANALLERNQHGKTKIE